MSLEFHFGGDKSLIDQMEMLQGPKAKKIFKKATERATVLIWLKTRSKAAAVLNRGYATGKLVSNIYFKVKSSARRGVYGYVAMPTRAMLGISKSDPFYYPAALEFGTANRKPQAFMRPAFNESREKAVRIASIVLKKEIPAALEKMRKSGAKKYRPRKPKVQINQTLTNLHG